MSDLISNISDNSFEGDVLNNTKPVLLDFWAEWCGPCKAITPILEEVAGEYAGRVEIKKINIDQNPDTPSEYGVRGIPTLMLFENKVLKDSIIGGVSKGQLSKWLDERLEA
ncbi:MAG: thioredoxin [Alphaproteobacteria bacterium]|nr:thioredoxin [Alphaproteobacteria bacterium]